MNCAHVRGRLSLLNSLDWWVTRSHKVPFLLGLEQGYSQLKYGRGPKSAASTGIESSGKAEGGEPSLGQGTGLGSLVRGREPVLRGGTPSPGKMRGRDRVPAPLGSYSWFWGEGVPPTCS